MAASAFTPPLLEVKNVSLRYPGSSAPAVWNVSFSVADGERVVLLGPSGSGKSTLLKALAGYISAAEGKVMLQGKEIAAPGPDRVVVFQEFDQLLPWKTVRENVVFALRNGKGLPSAEAARQAEWWLRKVRLERVLDDYPHTLSGGMKQRVAIARCLAMKPQVVLMDEPFASLDALTRRQMQEGLLELWKEERFAMVFVTHSIEEALVLGSRIVMLSSHPGQVKAEFEVNVETLPHLWTDELGRVRDRINDLLMENTLEYSI